MEYIGIDYHKQYSYAWSLNKETGEIRHGRVSNTEDAFRRFIREPSEARVVTEAGRTWTVLYDLLGEMVGEFHLAHPAKVRSVASARIKTDKIDARALCELLSVGMIPEAHIREEENRRKQQIIRQRVFWVATRTRIKNRIHVLIDRQRHTVREGLGGLSDIFGKAGLTWMRHTEELSQTDRRLLDDMLSALDLTNELIASSDKAVNRIYSEDEDAQLLGTLPGFGKVLATLVSTEIDGIERFSRAERLASYTGLIPSTYASGGLVRHGRITKEGNRWLRWGYVEAASRAKVLNAQLSAYYDKIEKRIGTKKATVALARRMVQISYTMLRDQRPFEAYRRPKKSGDNVRVAFNRP